MESTLRKKQTSNSSLLLLTTTSYEVIAFKSISIDFMQRAARSQISSFLFFFLPLSGVDISSESQTLYGELKGKKYKARKKDNYPFPLNILL